MRSPLSGIRVLDLTNVLSGPFCCAQLAYLGADVIKVEMPERGDLARQLGADADLNAELMGTSFLAQNAGKRSLTLNLKDRRGGDILRALVKGTDVLVENFRPGVMDRLDLGYDVLKGDNPRLIYCAISGFGQTGPMRDLPAYDQIIQGLSGVMSLTGDAQTAPQRVGYPLADTIGGLTAAMAINAALAGRGTTGTFIDVSMLEAMLASMGWVVSNYLIAGKVPRPMGNANFTAAPSGSFATATAPINLAANKQDQFEALCDLLDRSDLKTDPRFAAREARLANRDSLTAQIEAGFADHDADTLVDRLNAAGIPAGPILSLPQALALDQVQGRGFLRDFPDAGVAKPVRNAGAGYHLDGAAPDVDRPPPALGQDSAAILRDLGYDADAIAALKRDEVI
jgi:CoA:oxalate CoA-transferase